MYFAHPIDFFALPILKKKNTNLSGMVFLWYETWLILIRAILQQSINNKMVSKI